MCHKYRVTCPFLIAYLLIGVMTVFSLGCDEEVSPTSPYTLTFLSPQEDETLGCGQDQDRNSPMIIDRDVSLLVEAPEAEQRELVVVLNVDPPTFREQRGSLNSSGRVTFEALGFDPGSYLLTATLVNGAQERARVEIPVEVEFDATNTRCGFAQNRLVFVSPIEGDVFHAEDDLDDNLTNGLQIPVRVEVEGPIINDLVEIQVDGVAQGRVTAEGGVVLFESVSLPLTGSSTIKAIAQGVEGLIEASVTVEVDAMTCDLTLNPMPMDGCDIGTSLDVDPEREGVQAELSAETTCAQVIWTINGQVYTPVEVVNGRAVLVTTLESGENTVSARAQSANGLASEVPTYVLDVDQTEPTVDFEGLEQLGVNRLSRVDVDHFEGDEETGERGVWTFTGFTSEVASGHEVSLVIEPPIEGVASSVFVDEEGRFSFSIEGEYLCEHQLTGNILDPCGGVHSSPTYSLCLDGVIPKLELSAPQDGALLNAELDLDMELEGLQVDFSIIVDDPRPLVDYPIEIACRVSNGGADTVLSDEPILRSSLRPISEEEEVPQEGVIRVSFPRAGRYTCYAQASTGLNPPLTPTRNFRVITNEPIFELLDPVRDSNNESCVSSQLFIGGRSSQFELEDTQLTFVIRSETGQVARQGNLNHLGGDDFGADIPLGPEGLDDGRYTIEISGVSGALAVSIIPLDPIPLLVDSTPPALGIISPISDTISIADDLNNDLSDCIQSSVEISLDDESAQTVCYQLNDTLSRCEQVNEFGLLQTPPLNFLPGENQLRLSVLDCAGEKQEVEITLSTIGCLDPLRLISPLDGAGLSSEVDEDPQREGWQVSAQLQGDPSEQVSLDVFGEGFMLTFGPVTLDDEGRGVLTLDLPVPMDSSLQLSLTPRSEERGGISTQIQLLLSSSAINLRPLDEEGACVNSSVFDTSAQEGFQLNFIADGEGLALSQPPTLTVECGDDTSHTSGQITSLGDVARINFNSVSLPNEGSCVLTASARSLGGELLESTVDVLIDRVSPQVRLIRPNSREPLNLLNDGDNTLPGIQFEVRLEVCGAEGQVMTVNTTPEQSSGVLSLDVGEGECTEVSTGMLNFDQGVQVLTALAPDACGNVTTFNQEIEANTGVTLVLIDPEDQEIVSAVLDNNLNQAGCQLNITAASTGFNNTEGLELVLCANNQSGDLDPLCGAQVDVSEGNCEIIDNEARSIQCPISLSDGEHELTLVSRSNGVIVRSNPISIYSDCSPPEVEQLTVIEDVDANGCLNAQERSNLDSSSPTATFNAEFEVLGIEDGATIDLRVLPGERLISQATVQQGQGIFVGANLSPGDYELYLRGTDRANNPLPLTDSMLFNPVLISVDTSPPTPTLIFPSTNECLGINDDQDLQNSGLHFSPQMTTGGEAGEQLQLSLTIDRVVVQRINSNLSLVNFDVHQMSEGAHSLLLLSQDECGNIGSVSGFEMVNDRPVWANPVEVPVSVDLQAPTIDLQGVLDGQTLSSNEDANQNPADGFQLDLVVQTSGLEIGREVRVYSGNLRLRTSPPQLFISQEDTEALNVQVTLPPGPHELTVQGADACDNTSTSSLINILVDIQGCSSEILSLENNQIFGPAQGAVTSEGLRMDVTGRVDLLDPECANAQAELLLNNNVLLASAPIDEITGAVTFSEVIIPEGIVDISLRTRLQGETTDSLARSIYVDLTPPNPVLSAPSLNNEGVISLSTDEDPNTLGQQFTLSITIEESPIISDRSVQVSINQVVVRDQIQIANNNPQSLLIDGLDAPTGLSTFNVCVKDLAENERCLQVQVDADPAPPNTFQVTPSVLNPRVALVRASFTAPGDDGSGGDPVEAYELRWAYASINTESDWSLANILPEKTPFVLPGALEELLIDQLPPNQVIHLSVRARDNVGKLSAVRSVLVDTSLNHVEVDFIPNNGPQWSSGSLDGITGNRVHSLGDFDQDGYNDLLVGGSQISDNLGGAMIVFGSESLNSPRTLNLDLANSMSPILYGSSISALGDINGDGGVDLGVMGYRDDFSGSALALYFGCPLNQICDPVDLATADVLIQTPGVLRSFVGSAGDVLQANGVGFSEILLGGGVDVNNVYSDPRNIVIIEGRSDWPNTLSVPVTASNASLSDGIYMLNTSLQQSGAYSDGVGDLNGDGAEDFVFSAGGDFDSSFLVYGGADLEAALADGEETYSLDLSHFIQLDNPCSQLGQDSFGTYIKGGTDLNGDGEPDFIIGNYQNQSLIIFNHQLSLIDCFSRTENQFGVFFDFAGDIDGDGAQDLIITHEDSSVTDAFIFYNDGAGHVGENQERVGRTPSMKIEVPSELKLGVSSAGDMNQDTLDDFAILTYDDSDQLFKLNIFY